VRKYFQELKAQKPDNYVLEVHDFLKGGKSVYIDFLTQRLSLDGGPWRTFRFTDTGYLEYLDPAKIDDDDPWHGLLLMPFMDEFRDVIQLHALRAYEAFRKHGLSKLIAQRGNDIGHRT
jgi:hypothetical protein